MKTGAFGRGRRDSVEGGVGDMVLGCSEVQDEKGDGRWEEGVVPSGKTVGCGGCGSTMMTMSVWAADE